MGKNSWSTEGVGHTQMYDKSVHVPLIMRIPGLAGFRINGLVETIDITPTLLSLVDIPLPYYTQGKNLLDHEDKIFTHAEFGDKNLLRSKRWSFIMTNNGDVELYNLIKRS